MKSYLLMLGFLFSCLNGHAENRTYSSQVKSLQAVVNQDWLSPCGDDCIDNDTYISSFVAV